jgi:small subunit ribosomal protein S6
MVAHVAPLPVRQFLENAFMSVHIGQYEGLFLINPSYAGGNWDAARQEVEHILNRANAEILHLRKWDERRLAYPVKGHKRGLFVLAFFRCEGPRVAGIERDVQLSTNILRALVIKADHLALADVEQMTPQQPAAEDHPGRGHRRSHDRQPERSTEAPSEPELTA